MKPVRTFSTFLNRQSQRGEAAVVARGAGQAFLLQGLRLGLGYLLHVLLARWMGAAEYGVYSYVLAWAALLAAPAGVGLPLAVVRFVPEYSVRKEWGLLRGLLRWSWRRVLGAGVGLALAATALVTVLGAPAVDAYAPSLWIGIAMTPLLALMRLMSGLYQSVHRVGRSEALPVLRHALVLAVTYALLRWGGALTSVQAVGATLGATLAVMAVQTPSLLRAFPAELQQVPATYAPRAWLRVARPLLLAGGFILLLHQTDLLMVGTLLGSQEAGLYQAASRTAGLGSLMLAAAGTATAPMVARLYTRRDYEPLQRLLAAVAHGIFWPSLAFVLILVVAAGPILRLFGDEFVAARSVLWILAGGQLVNAGAGAVASLLNLTGYQRWGASIFGVGVALNVALNAVGIALFGLVGAALATAFSVMGINVALCVVAHRKLKLNPSIVFALWRWIKKRTA